ncbi:Myc-type, basic helix-loop-helix domain-containing protein, partial [Gamsiella multidivaricata]|uniref:Myc-type, basic helix-loop-helix domain-containing protein n=1 Tax=Gamsiella multidivaricata TaxID=101098 RepID=UPI002220F35F
ELRRTSHKAAEQKRRDSLKHCFDDLRNMIPSIQEKSPSKVFLLKKSFDYICNLKCEVAKRDLEMARLKAQHEFMK